MPERPTTDSLPAEQWAGEMGEKWLKHLDRFEGMIAPIGEALMTYAAFRPGQRVADVGCGAGATSLDIAQQVGREGEVIGIDISPQLIDAAARRAQAAKADNVSFRCADAAVIRMEGPRFDRLFSRFGLMFFADPMAAFANLHRLVRPGGRIDFCAWAPARENMWVAQMMAIIGQHVELPAPVPRAPGPFALEDPDYIRELLGRGGFADVHIDSWNGDQLVAGAGASARQATDFVSDAMSFGRLLDNAGPGVREEVNAQLTALFTRYHDAEGVRMSAKALLVSAIA